MSTDHIRLVDGIAADIDSELKSISFESKQEIDNLIKYLESMIAVTIKEFKKDAYHTVQ